MLPLIFRYCISFCLTIMLIPTGRMEAQIHMADSLESHIHNATDDREKLSLIIRFTNMGKVPFYEKTKYADTGVSLARKLGDSLSIAILRNNIGEAVYFSGKYDEAGAYFYSALYMLEQQEPGIRDSCMGHVLNNLAKLYRKTGAYDKSEHYYKRAMDAFVRRKDSFGIQAIWNESGVLAEYKKEPDEAMRRYFKALELARLLDDSTGIGYAFNFLGGLFFRQGAFIRGEQYMDSSLRIRERMQDTFALALTYADMGELYAAKKDYKKATDFFLQSNELAIAMYFPDLTAHNYRQLAAVSRATAAYEDAFSYYARAETIKDSLFNIEKAKQLQTLEAQYQTEKKEQQLLVQALQLNRKNYIIAAILMAVLSGGVIAYSAYKRYKLRQETRLQEAVIRQQDMATRAVLEAEEKERQRIARDLHDGVGQMMSAVKLNLSSFRTDINSNDTTLQEKFENIFSLVDDSCREVRSVSHNMMPNALLKAGLAQAVREFLHKLDTPALKVNLYTEGLEHTIDNNTEIMLYRVIQECVNNVIKHAQAFRLDISIIKDEHEILVTIEDNGKGFDHTDKNKPEGIGLKNINSRVAYLKGIVEFDSKPGKGTVVTISIPLTNNA